MTSIGSAKQIYRLQAHFYLEVRFNLLQAGAQSGDILGQDDNMTEFSVGGSVLFAVEMYGEARYREEPG